MNKLLKQRFDELADQAKKVEATKRREAGGIYGNVPMDCVNDELLLGWTVKAQDTLSKVCGVESQHYMHFSEAEKGGAYRTNYDNFKRMNAIFIAAKEDFEGGYLSSVRTLVQAEVFDSELEQATELLRNGYKAPAAVIAGTVLETSLRELCNQHQLTHGKLDKMNADLAKQGIYNANVAKRVTALAAIRNSAAHGKCDEFPDADVKAMIEDIKRFLSQFLS